MSQFQCLVTVCCDPTTGPASNDVDEPIFGSSIQDCQAKFSKLVQTRYQRLGWNVLDATVYGPGYAKGVRIS